jgi:hypothetical protein
MMARFISAGDGHLKWWPMTSVVTGSRLLGTAATP